ncbi:MAG: hypothetical protein GY839_06120 [candidate division Zixibacteria bacterium]|nr:hypothetical protein [candidate division Zixibacteria bacterium]
MKTKKSIRITIIIMALMLLCYIQSAKAADVTINGFGHQSYITTDTNTYVVDNATEGSFKDYVMGLTFTAKASEKAFIKAQIVRQGTEFRLDWGFGQYQVNEYFGIKGGKIKLPFGFYTETMDVKALQPFTFLTGIYFYGVNSFNGFGAFGSYELENGLSGELEIYGGSSPTSDGLGILKDFLGTQVWINPPLDGLRMGFGYWQMALEVTGWPEMDVSVMLASAEYIGNKIFIRSEYNRNSTDDVAAGSNIYVEGGYLVHDLVQPVVRWAHSSYEEEEAVLVMRGLTKTEDAISFGVNLFPTDGIVFKLEHHIVDGNTSLEPTQRTGQNLVPGDSWGLTAASIAFMF